MWIKIKGVSMLPFLADGSLARVALCSIANLQSGDIIVVKQSDGFIAHRLINKIRRNNKWYLRTKGDISLKCDELVNSERLIGKVVTSKFFGISLTMNNSVGRFVGLGFSYLTPLVYCLWNTVSITLSRKRNLKVAATEMYKIVAVPKAFGAYTLILSARGGSASD